MAKSQHLYSRLSVSGEDRDGGESNIPTKAWNADYPKLTAERKTFNQRYFAAGAAGAHAPAERRIWSGNRKGGGIVNTKPVALFWIFICPTNWKLSADHFITQSEI